MEKKYYLEIIQTWYKLEDFGTYHEAVEAMRQEEAADMAEERLIPWFYGIWEY